MAKVFQMTVSTLFGKYWIHPLLYSSIEFVQMVTLGSVEVGMILRVEWRFATMQHGALCVTTCGDPPMLV